MTLQEISQASRLNPGADLWVIPEVQHSKSAQKIDWYLNFQMTRSTYHTPKKLPQKVSEILEKSELRHLDWVDEKTPLDPEADLLILSAPSLPNRWVMVIKNDQDFENWIHRIHKNWIKMNSPSLRIFLPEGISGSQFEKAWRHVCPSKNEDLQKIGFVPES